MASSYGLLTSVGFLAILPDYNCAHQQGYTCLFIHSADPNDLLNSVTKSNKELQGVRTLLIERLSWAIDMET